MRPISYIVLGLFCLTATLKISLAINGGQFFIPDENMILKGYEWLSAGDHVGSDKKARIIITSNAGHVGFRMLSVPIAWIHSQIGTLPPKHHPLVPAVILALLSSLMNLSVFFAAKRIFKETTPAAIAMLLTVLATTLTYYSRHLLPYDTSLLFVFLSIIVALSDPKRANRNLLLSGILNATGFFIYNGHWPICFLVGLFCIIRGGSLESKPLVKRSIAFVTGCVLSFLPILTLFVVGRIELFTALSRFASAVNHGDFAEGFLIHFRYLLAAEGLGLITWAIGALGTAFYLRDSKTPIQTRISVVTIGFIIPTLVIALHSIQSVGLERMVVYGRLIRQIVPFLCIGMAAGLWMLWSSKSKWVTLLCLVPAFFQIGLSSSKLFSTTYPEEFKKTQLRAFEFRYFHEIYTLYSPRYQPPPETFTAPHLFVNAGCVCHTYAEQEAPRGEILIEALHPVSIFHAYNFEGHDAKARAKIKFAQPKMQLIKLEALGPNPK